MRRRPRLQRIDDRVDLAPRLAHPIVDPLIQPLAERLFAVAQILLARLHPGRRVLQHLTLARDQPPLVLQLLHVALDLREMLGQLRSPARSAARRACSMMLAGRPSRVAISTARLLPGDP